MTILFTCAGRRNYLIRYFKEIIGDSGRTIAVDSNPIAAALADADIALTVPTLNSSTYVPTLLRILEDYGVDLVIPLNDIELPIMSANKRKLEAYGAKVIISCPDLIDICADKWRTFIFFEDLKIPTAKSFLRIDDVLLALDEKRINFPIILKPRWGFGSVGIEEVETEEELRLAYRLLLIKMDKNLMASMGWNASKNQIIFQEKINGEEYGIDILNDFEGNYYGAFARKKLAMRAGETDKAISAIDSRFTEIAEKIGKATRHIGTMDCDFFVSNGKVYFLEMNPRFGGGYPFSHSAGINIPAMYLEWLKGNIDVSGYNNYKSDQVFSKHDNIVRIGDYETAVEKDVTSKRHKKNIGRNPMVFGDKEMQIP
ncbi:ATP-grasp domain-containing protein [Pricia sp.]|uniref:ATP-grasp domain-containing protein n=1 Tax=Pricia sp. TaxID=2268138 RepID=UPI00359474FC